MKKKDKTFKQYIGTKGEDAAAGLLKDKGYNILRRNYAVHNVGEIDIIAERGSAGEYQADERTGVARLSWRVSGR